jgi:hypothetical protein
MIIDATTPISVATLSRKLGLDTALKGQPYNVPPQMNAVVYREGYIEGVVQLSVAVDALAKATQQPDLVKSVEVLRAIVVQLGEYKEKDT